MHIYNKDSWTKHFDFLVIDIISMILSFFISDFLLKSFQVFSSSLYKIIIPLIISAILIINTIFKPYSGVLRRNNAEEFRVISVYAAYYLLIFFIIAFIFQLGSFKLSIELFLACFLYISICFILRTIWKNAIFKWNKKFFSKQRIPLLLVVEENKINEIIKNIDNERYSQYDIKGLCIYDKETSKNEEGYLKPVCDYESIDEFVIQNNIREVYFAIKPEKINKQLLEKLLSQGVGIQLDIDSMFEKEWDNYTISKIGIYHTLGLGVYSFKPQQVAYLLFKRLFDIVFSLIAILFFPLLWLIIKVAYLLCGDTSPILIKQNRIGLNGNVFCMYKFRSMVFDAPEQLKELLKNEKVLREWNEHHKITNDPRITPVGKILRKTSIDEFPQFINVFKGDMSIVGPRPLVDKELEKHNGLKLYQRVRPGITGWWACNGRSNISYKERLEFEYYYVKNYSLFLDTLILLRTVVCVIKKTGAQ